MILEELIYQRFLNSAELKKCLAVFSGLPAVFCPEPPNDDHAGWDGRVQYPKIIYNFDLQADRERKSVGALSVSLLCQNTADVAPEDIEPEVKKCLRDVMLKPKGAFPYCFAWARTDAFTIEEKLTIGCEVRFDILEYPSWETTDPDPVAAANQYIKKLFPECIVMGFDKMGEVTEASKETPVIYCRLAEVEKGVETNTVAWMDGKIAVHVLCPDSGRRIKIVAAIANRMSLDGEIIMLDHSPMTITRLQTDYQSDYLKEGQLFVTVHYGLLRYRAKGHCMSTARLTSN